MFDIHEFWLIETNGNDSSVRQVIIQTNNASVPSVRSRL